MAVLRLLQSFLSWSTQQFPDDHMDPFGSSILISALTGHSHGCMQWISPVKSNILVVSIGLTRMWIRVRVASIPPRKTSNFKLLHNDQCSFAHCIAQFKNDHHGIVVKVITDSISFSATGVYFAPWQYLNATKGRNFTAVRNQIQHACGRWFPHWKSVNLGDLHFIAWWVAWWKAHPYRSAFSVFKEIFQRQRFLKIHNFLHQLRLTNV